MGEISFNSSLSISLQIKSEYAPSSLARQIPQHANRGDSLSFCSTEQEIKHTSKGELVLSVKRSQSQLEGPIPPDMCGVEIRSFAAFADVSGMLYISAAQF